MSAWEDCKLVSKQGDDGFLTSLDDASWQSASERELMRAQRLTTIIFIGMLLGIGVGYACHQL
jgi:hypothetical protein